MERRHFLAGCACCGLGALFASLAQAETAWIAPPRLQRPETASDEGGLWALLDREEAKLKRSRFLVRDPALNAYVNGVACRLAGAHCPDMRLYIVRTPYFNASMAPNGMMQVWTGLMLRMANEAQLAAVLGHEIGHYLERHTLDRMRDAKSRSAFGQFVGLLLNAAGGGSAGPLAQLLVAAGSFSFSRDQERDADRIGLELMARAGYEPLEASKVWAQLIAELKAESDWTGQPEQRSVLFASHPDSEERRGQLEERAKTLAGDAHELGTAAWQAAIRPWRRGLLDDELKRRRSGETLALLARLIEGQPEDGELRFYLGEAHRLRGADGDTQGALDAYAAAEQKAAAPPELFRSRGLLLTAEGKEAAARQAFARYLALRPDAEDAALIASYIDKGVNP